MKINTWLMVSYLIVMALPVAVFIFLLHLIQSFDKERDIADYLEIQSKTNYYEEVLENPILYGNPGPAGELQTELSRLESLSSPDVSFSIFDREGNRLFTTHSDTLGSSSTEEVFQHLYELRASYQTFQYKEPVLYNNQIIGFYEIIFSRNEWISGVEKRKTWAIALFAAAFLLIYWIAVKLVAVKVATPLKGLMEEMKAFAGGEQEESALSPDRKDEIGALIRQFNEMKQELLIKQNQIEKEQEQKQFIVASISHDIKTPLTTIRATAENLFGKMQQENKGLRSILEKADFIHGMIDDLSMYSLLKSNETKFSLVQVEAMEFFEMLLSGYEELAEEHNCELHLTVSAEGSCLLHPKQMMRVTDNLISNAVRHTFSDGIINAGAISAGSPIPEWLCEEYRRHPIFQLMDTVWLVIQNEGSPIPAEEKEAIFEPLYQLDPSRTKKANRGSGLGLSISKMIIEKHGGHIEILSGEGSHTAVVCALPKVKEGAA
ncbi:HAMP domain-containing sensor histidine kinase [Bacillus sp. M6-12]|uniref:HAMP domain-containing sensor histidine kinase n=1 Tax=Bacillus sp. M6-12 TaxID=2054166 RepID=UPI0015E1348F|nr:HAMP domain-containing sensor histidine kinase [Bacillus sp. M6-12]